MSAGALDELLPLTIVNRQKLVVDSAGSVSFKTRDFMSSTLHFAISDLAYTDAESGFRLDEAGRIAWVDGRMSTIGEKLEYEFPVRQRLWDWIAGFRLICLDEDIVQIAAKRWRIRPSQPGDHAHFEVSFDAAITFQDRDRTIRIVKNGSIFSCTELHRDTAGGSRPVLAWTMAEYQLGLPAQVRSLPGAMLSLPYILVWEPGLMGGYTIDPASGEYMLDHKASWQATGKVEVDRHNFMVMLTQRHYGAPLLTRNRGAVEMLWLAMLMYDNVIDP